jgi:hypothetical protein
MQIQDLLSPAACLLGLARVSESSLSDNCDVRARREAPAKIQHCGIAFARAAEYLP